MFLETAPGEEIPTFLIHQLRKIRIILDCSCRQVSRKWETAFSFVYNSQSDAYGMKSFIIDKHSFLLFIAGFFFCRDPRRCFSAFLVAISPLYVKIVHFISNSIPPCASILCSLNDDVRLFFSSLAKCKR